MPRLTTSRPRSGSTICASAPSTSCSVSGMSGHATPYCPLWTHWLAGSSPPAGSGGQLRVRRGKWQEAPQGSAGSLRPARARGLAASLGSRARPLLLRRAQDRPPGTRGGGRPAPAERICRLGDLQGARAERRGSRRWDLTTCAGPGWATCSSSPIWPPCRRIAGHASVATTARYDWRDHAVQCKAAGQLHVPYVPSAGATCGEGMQWLVGFMRWRRASSKCARSWRKSAVGQELAA
jgi:hypothetical protein